MGYFSVFPFQVSVFSLFVMAKDKKMFNTLVYWDGKKEFYTANDIDREMHFIAYLVNGLNQIVKAANPTVYNFDSDSLKELYKSME